MMAMMTDNTELQQAKKKQKHHNIEKLWTKNASTSIWIILYAYGVLSD